MKDFKLTISSLGYFVSEVTKLITRNQDKYYRVNIVEWREKRSLSQNAFQHVIYKEISDYLISKGRKDWTPEFTKKNLKNKFLGWSIEEFIDVSTGKVTQHETLRSTSKLDTGESYQYTTEILDWADSIGCQIKIPANSQYMELYREQNK